ncbi:glutamate--cysteine ligase [Pseudomonas matsuisoli]|uniref:Glutamate--cysteine ligase n=1 Tax=Pseudomonas matsuisoli TaxID=1515666 RepID=A0A917UY70_9PSED|nr:glutamate--cysteine ligase [Pseudomonas matsuisoli]GGJ95273.1 glutamate--cysteine ligase [Pseudomonas matsuisoli]
MSELLSRRLALLGAPAHLSLLVQGRHGIERETLRVNRDGTLALTEHPVALGSALTHERITTDYAEALLEFVTPTSHLPAQTLEHLDNVHRYVYGKLDGELLWSPSMPCPLPDEADIPIGYYGTSLIGRLKHVYRKGLALRYGKTMQCIAGIHYNFSVSEDLWALLRTEENGEQDAQAFQSERYISLIRNFRRYSWLLMYLFGASPALDKNFLRGNSHALETFDADTLYLPYATSLRMSDLGYQSHAQKGLTPCYNDLDSYLGSLHKAVSTPYPPYVEAGTKRDGEWIQLNTNIIQIENEYYSSIRPKRVARSGERPIQALRSRGIQYIEVRCIDIDPFLPSGIDLDEARFLDTFLLYCALNESPLLQDGDCAACSDNFLSVVEQGRKPDLQLRRRGESIAMTDWANELMDKLKPVAELLDRAEGTDGHRQSLSKQRAKVADPELTPSARVLAEMRQQGESFTAFSLRQSEAHADYFRGRPLAAGPQAEFEAMARESIEQQVETERQDEGDFDTFVAAYQASILSIAT